MGYAIIQGNLLDVFFARHVYKSLLGRYGALSLSLSLSLSRVCAHTHSFILSVHSPYTVQDLEALDISFYNSLVYVLENDPAPLELTFTVLEVNFGEVRRSLSLSLLCGCVAKQLCSIINR